MKKSFLKIVFITLIIFTCNKAFSQGYTYQSTKGYSIYIPDIWKDLTERIYFGGRNSGDITIQSLGIDKAIILSTRDTLLPPYITIFALGDTGPKDFDQSISDANNVLGMGIVEIQPTDDVKSLVLANPNKVYIDRTRQIIFGGGKDVNSKDPNMKIFTVTRMGKTKGVMFVCYSSASDFSTNIDRFLEIVDSAEIE